MLEFGACVGGGELRPWCGWHCDRASKRRLCFSTEPGSHRIRGAQEGDRHNVGVSTRRGDKRHLYFLPHDGNRHVDAFYTRENVGDQITPLVGFGISPIPHRRPRRRCNGRWAQSPPCHRAEIPDVVASTIRTGSFIFANYGATGRSLAHGLCPLKR